MPDVYQNQSTELRTNELPRSWLRGIKAVSVYHIEAGQEGYGPKRLKKSGAWRVACYAVFRFSATRVSISFLCSGARPMN